MYISKVSLVNYRNFKNSSFVFKEGVNTLIGENGAGKTNLFNAIRLLLDDSCIQYAYKLNENDFNRSQDTHWKGHWIIISIEFDKLDSNEAIQSLFSHGVGVIEGEAINKATYTLFFRPKIHIRQRLAELNDGDFSGLENILSGINIQDDYETVFHGKSTENFNDPHVYKALVGDFQSVRFPKEIDASKFGVRIPHQLSVSKEISFTFIQALRDVVSDFKNNRTNPLLTLLKRKSDEINQEEYQPISELVLTLNESIERLSDVQEIKGDIETTFLNTIGRTYSPSSLSIKSNVPNEAEKLLQSLKLFMSEPDEEYEGGVHELSLGSANLIFLTLKLLEFKYRKAKETFANFLVIEEPEAHIHNHIQKTLFDKLDYDNTQIIYSTHSTQISEVSNVENINILGKKINYSEVYQPSVGLSKESLNQIQRYLDAVRTNLLFAKGIILIEGDAEEILIPILIKKVFGLSLDELGVSLINIRSTGFQNVAQLFHDLRIRRYCSILTDLDSAICDTTIISTDNEKIKKYKQKVARSEKSGFERKIKLDQLEKTTRWVKCFYAEYTFEVDFIKAGNSWEVNKIVDDIYTDQDTITQAITEIENSEVAIFGRRVLRMANHVGKGWFAILLGKNITEFTEMPEYIMEAIIFAREDYSCGLLADIIEYRVSLYENDEENNIDFSDFYNILENYRRGKLCLNNIVDKLEEIIEYDQIITFLNIILRK
ncbi:AAA family ATPase [Acinetobacter baumannii]|uniref:ATP-dependent nuclease n=1 Tax=Acinetobacter baumannii TaxID=470 RepID=UPI0021E265D5|nr:AAA family ATPase [Acinetobacter baumannii]MCV2390666.1 AAA family ATPase [Acinetobacter baumannii]MDC5259439.1 AAA family ATPase [Acinetobacter baumannii]MDV7376894.1 AAA family ATPase [Acinetobacter baumannii]